MRLLDQAKWNQAADYKRLTIGYSTSAAEEFQKLAPGAMVVKAFNTIFAELLPTESRKGRKVQVFIAGDDQTVRRRRCSNPQVCLRRS